MCWAMIVPLSKPAARKQPLGRLLQFCEFFQSAQDRTGILVRYLSVSCWDFLTVTYEEIA